MALIGGHVVWGSMHIDCWGRAISRSVPRCDDEVGVAGPRAAHVFDGRLGRALGVGVVEAEDPQASFAGGTLQTKVVERVDLVAMCLVGRCEVPHGMHLADLQGLLGG